MALHGGHSLMEDDDCEREVEGDVGMRRVAEMNKEMGEAGVEVDFKMHVMWNVEY